MAEQQYQLVLQFPAQSSGDYDKIIELEESIEEHLSGDEEVDGHDSGSGEMNIFIITGSPSKTFEKVKAILQPHLPRLKAAYRSLDEDTYTVLFPQGLREFDVV
jgi:hypothetical protein